ncbi:hypothetical protein NTGM5_220003 [Candidatus Nitrotoga sp. M5]|nr:hypothetical protein NTGM5_220003 [Candidatus Nitrotoga sp. M5]
MTAALGRGCSNLFTQILNSNLGKLGSSTTTGWKLALAAEVQITNQRMYGLCSIVHNFKLIALL